MNDYFYMAGEDINYDLLEDNLTSFRMINNLIK